MTDQPPFQAATTTLPPQSANGSARVPPASPAARRVALQTRLTRMRTTLIAGLAALTIAVIFIIQNVHAANISFLGAHLVLPLAGALLLAAATGSLLTIAAGPARITPAAPHPPAQPAQATAGSAAPDHPVANTRGLRPPRSRPASTGHHRLPPHT